MRRRSALAFCVFASLAFVIPPALRAQDVPAAHRLRDLAGVVQASFNHDASRIVARTASGAVGIWDAVTGAPISGDLGLATTGEGFILSPDTRRVVIALPGGGARVFDTASAAALSPRLEFPWHENAQPCAVFSPDGATLVALEAEAAVVFAVSSGERLARLAIPLRGEDSQSGLTAGAIFSASGAHCWLLDRTGVATRYDARTWKPLGSPLRHPSAPSAFDFGFAVSADDRWLATFDSPGENGPKAHLQVWDIATGKAVGKPLVAVNGLAGYFFPDQARILITPARGEATVRELPSLKTSVTIRAHDDVEGPSVKLSPGGQWLLSWGPDRIVRLLDARSGTIKDSQTFHATISQVLLLPDSTGAFLAFDNSAFFLQDHHDHYLVRLRFPQAEVAQVHRFTAQLRHTALSPDGRRLLAIFGETDRERLLLLDAETLQTIEPPRP